MRTATTLSDTSAVTPNTDQGSSAPLLNTMLLVPLQYSVCVCVFGGATGTAETGWGQGGRVAARETSTRTAQVPDTQQAREPGTVASKQSPLQVAAAADTRELQTTRTTSQSPVGRAAPPSLTSNPGPHAAPPSTSVRAPPPRWPCSVPLWPPSQRAPGPKTCWRRQQGNTAVPVPGTQCTPGSPRHLSQE
jgi:hypothetical protein